MSDAEWKRIDSIVRPQRYALLIKDEVYWHHTCQRAIEAFTQLWGGAGFIIIPTDGQTISEKFWDILQNYSPDYIGSYKISFKDLKWADPETYASNIERVSAQLISQGFEVDRIDEYIRDNEAEWRVNEFSLSDNLKQELLNRLSPFHYARTIDRYNIHAGAKPDYPFTQVSHILPYSKTKPVTVYAQKELTDPIFNLLAKMKSGAITDEFATDLESSEIQISNILDNLSNTDYLNLLERGESDRLSRVIAEEDFELPEDFLSLLPNSLSLNGLAKYFKIEPGVTEKDYVTVVVGDSLEDFCFAFSLSKILNNIYWMPDNHLQEAYTESRRIIRARENGNDLERESENTSIIRCLATNYAQKIGYGGDHSNKKIVFTSVSLSKQQLNSRRRKILGMAYVGVTGERTHTLIRSADEIDIAHTGTLLEINNYANDQAIAFVDGEGVERIRSIKPKNFDYIDAQNHRWIQTISINGFSPPPLPSLGGEIFKNGSSRYQVRVGKDGLSYLLPGIAYFVGHDIDTTLSRPELKLITSNDIFAHYFASHYLVFPSDKGKYFNDTVEKFGSIDTAADFFKNASYNALLNQFTEKERSDENSRRDERIFLEYSSRAYLDIKAVKNALGQGHNAGNVIDYLLSIKVLRRGLILFCHNCSCSAWYDNDNIGQEFECARCRTRQQILKENWKKPDEPSWYYSLAETVHQFYKSNSHITLLALRHIKGNSTNFHYVPELELREMRDNGDRLEIDIACIKDGEIYLGEAKNRKLESADLSKYLALNNLMSPKPHRLVFATNHDSVPQAVRNRITSSGVGNKTIFIMHDNLFTQQ